MYHHILYCKVMHGICIALCSAMNIQNLFKSCGELEKVLAHLSQPYLREPLRSCPRIKQKSFLVFPPKFLSGGDNAKYVLQLC